MKLILNSPLDMHLHLRDGDMLKNVAPLTSENYSGALVMPNLTPPITTKEALIKYRDEILALSGKNFKPYMSLFFQKDYSYEFLKELKDEILVVKLYPAGATTNSESGVVDFDVEELRPTLEAMSELEIPLSIHGESDGFFLDREAEFIPVYEKLAEAFPKLKIIMEHISSKEAVKILDKHENLYASITLHHMLYTFDDVAGGKLNPHLFCKPVLKREKDRRAILKLALNAHPKVMFGSDSAPHLKEAKEGTLGAAGVFTAPVTLQALAELFEKHNKLDNLQKFVSNNAKKIYNITPPQKEVVLVKERFKVPNLYGNVVPILAGQELSWSIESVK